MLGVFLLTVRDTPSFAFFLGFDQFFQNLQQNTNNAFSCFATDKETPAEEKKLRPGVSH